MQTIATERLRDGRIMELLLVSAPDALMLDGLTALLGHKGEPWTWHVRECLREATPGMATLFYVARVAERLVGNVTLFRTGTHACIAHVYTVPELRGLGIARRLLNAAIAVFERDNGQLIVLGTEFDSMPWRLYASIGFTGICPEQCYGGMIRFSPGVDWAHAFPGPAGAVVAAEWRHFVDVQLLFGAPGPEQFRSLLLHSIGPRFTEGQFIELKYRQQQGTAGALLVIEGADAAVLGAGMVAPHPLWQGQGARHVLDLYVHPTGQAQAPALLAALLADDTPVECYCDSAAAMKMALLRQHGFHEVGRVASQFRFGDETRDLLVLAR